MKSNLSFHQGGASVELGHESPDKLEWIFPIPSLQSFWIRAHQERHARRAEQKSGSGFAVCVVGALRATRVCCSPTGVTTAPAQTPADLPLCPSRVQRSPARCKLGSAVRGASLAPVPLNGQWQTWWERDMASLYLHSFQVVLRCTVETWCGQPPDFRSSTIGGVHRLHRLPNWPPGLILVGHLQWLCSSLQTLPDAIC